MNANGYGKFKQNILIFGNNFKIEYEQLLEMYNGGQCVMVLFKNMMTTSKGKLIFKGITLHNFNKDG